MKNWPWYLWAVFACLVLFLFGSLSYLFYLYWTVGFFTIYVGLVALAIFSFIGITKYFAGTKELHIHHYVLGMFVLTFTCYQNFFVTVLNGVFAGIMIEGGSRWGYDPIWEPIQQFGPWTMRQKARTTKTLQSQARAHHFNQAEAGAKSVVD